MIFHWFTANNRNKNAIVFAKIDSLKFNLVKTFNGMSLIIWLLKQYWMLPKWFLRKKIILYYPNIQIKILSISETARHQSIHLLCFYSFFIFIIIQLEVKFTLIFYSHLNHTVLMVTNFIFYLFNIFFLLYFFYLFFILTCSAVLGVEYTYIHLFLLFLCVVSSCQIVILSA